ncbi:MAG: hypothetical protein LBJ77_03650 [Holosporales bacterium]|jgi:hypothetical protein|nr:hypothetical protein [Holosporales bacterium]
MNIFKKGLIPVIGVVMLGPTVVRASEEEASQPSSYSALTPPLLGHGSSVMLSRSLFWDFVRFLCENIDIEVAAMTANLDDFPNNPEELISDPYVSDWLASLNRFIETAKLIHRCNRDIIADGTEDIQSDCVNNLLARRARIYEMLTRWGQTGNPPKDLAAFRKTLEDTQEVGQQFCNTLGSIRSNISPYG